MTARLQSHLQRTAQFICTKMADPVSFIFALGNVCMAAVMIWTIGLVLIGGSDQYMMGLFIVFFQATIWVIWNAIRVAVQGNRSRR